MTSRTEYQHIITDIGVASMCGIGIAFAILRGDIITRVGFGIAITVLPAMVNAGMYLGLTYQYYLKNNKDKNNTWIINLNKDKERLLKLKNHINSSFNDAVKKIITTSVDKSKLDTLFQKNLDETKNELKKINS